MSKFFKKTLPKKTIHTGRKFTTAKKLPKTKVSSPKNIPSNNPPLPTPVSSSHETEKPFSFLLNDIKTKTQNVKVKQTLDALDDLLAGNTLPKTNMVSQANDVPNATYSEEQAPIENFNGVSDPSETKELYTEAATYERKRANAIEEKLKLLEEEKKLERKVLEKEIKSLKQELHRTVPIQDNVFLSLSKELKDAINQIEHLAKENGISTNISPDSVLPSTSTPTILNIPESTIPSPAIPSTTKAVPEVNVSTIPKSVVQLPKTSLSSKKTLITGASATAMALLIGGLATSSLLSKPKIDPKIVNQYLSSPNGSVQGITSENQPELTTIDPSQAEVSFEQSSWEEFKDPSFGVILQYPKNSVKAIRTESNITFIRKTGYLFKIQRIETALNIDEYWKQIKATSLKYTVSNVKFKSKNSLKLDLDDTTDYPGNRYLIKEGNFIYDIWYATNSKNFSKDDILKADKMLSSLSIVTNQP